jgi:hypothetical protein
MILDVLRHFLIHIERRMPPQGVEVAASLGDITSCFEVDAGRLAARYDADQQAAQRRRPHEDDFLRQGDAYSRPE